MKLTKGKISKLYNKKKQTLKKFKTKKSSYKRKTFRDRKQFNLAKKTLKHLNYKKFIGGNIDYSKDEYTNNTEYKQQNGFNAINEIAKNISS
jgi:hypothetical protein